LTQKGVEFEVYDVRENPRKLKEMVDLTGRRQVPVIVVGDRFLVGFDPGEVEALLRGDP
ncbi:MAG: glutaredoxin family protein, partial [Deltaproteobacteria bacterium]|nr:glutaredoxin family protein [Deltaproteobacteria bacterium]